DFYIVTLLDDTQYVTPNSLKQIEFNTNGKIPDYLCYGLTSITKVTDKSSSTTNIGKHAFDGCTNLIDFIIQNTTISLIDEYAFQNCTSLTTMPEFHLKEVKKYAFANCNSLLVAPSLEDVNYIGDYAFSGCSLIKSIKVTNATYMGLNSLYGCSSLTELEVPFVGTSIKSSEAFGVIFGTTSYDNSYAVTQLSKTYYVPNGLVRLTIGGNSIRENACVNLTNVTTLIISDSVETIGEGAFNGFNSLESITLPFVGKSDDAQNYEAVFGFIFGYKTYGQSTTYFKSPNYDYVNEQIGSIDGLTWQYTCHTYRLASGSYDLYCKNSYYYIPASLKYVTVTMDTTIPVAAFNGCSMLEKINIPLETDSIGVAAFQNCTSLKQFNSNQDGAFNIPEAVTTINDYSFYSCSLASNVSLSNSVLAIGKNAFAKCSLVDKFNSNEITNLIIPEACQNIGFMHFQVWH
ncbi:MAG: leucine-rich repeat protein, partial [Bacilli bacterium]